MKTLPPALKAHVAGEVTTLCYCWRITRRDGIALGFTEHDRDLTVDGALFEAASGFAASQIQSSLGLAVDNLTASGALSSERVTEADILAGRYDDAVVELLWANWADPTQFIVVMRGHLGEVKRHGLAFTAELRSLAHRFNQPVGRAFDRLCNARLGDEKCRVDLGALPYSGIGTVTTYDGGRFLTLSGLSRFAPGWFTDGIASYSGRIDVLIGGSGLIVNNLQSGLGRGAYFADGSGTSEGQFVAIHAWLRAAKALAATNPDAAASFKARALRMTAPLERAVYRRKIPSDPNELFVPHWLYAARQPIEAQTVFLKYPATFVTAGAGRQFNIPANTKAFGDRVIKVYSAYHANSKLLWDNPYSPVVGTAFTILSAVTSPSGTLVTISGASPSPASGYIVFAVDIGGAIKAGEPYEAWPVWRSLAPGEVDGAGDSFRWAFDMFAELYAATGSKKWSDALAASKNTCVKVMAPDDGRNYFKRSYSSDPYSLAGTFVFNARAGVQWTRDARTGILAGSIPQDATGAEAQVGRGFDDTIPSTATIKIRVGSDRPTYKVDIFLDTSTTYSPSTRYFATLGLSGNGEGNLDEFNLPLASFKRTDGDGAPITNLTFPLALKTCGFRDKEPAAHRLFIESVRPLPQTALPYAPYVVPFTANVLSGEIIEWRGSPGSGYQSPDMWVAIGGASAPVGAQTQCQFLRDAQLAYQTTIGQLGPFAHCYVWPRADSTELGTPGTWVYTWYDPNSRWGGYQYRPLKSVARFLWATSGDAAYAAARAIAETVLSDYLTWLDATGWPSLTGAVAGPPTDFPGDAAPARNYEEPHFAALILRAATYALMANALQALPANIVTRATSLASRAFAYLDGKYRASGPLAGTWSPDGTSWFGFWNAEIVSTLSLLLLDGDSVRAAIGVPPATIAAQLAGNDAWLSTVTQPPFADLEIKRHSINPDGSALIELWTDPAINMAAGDKLALFAGCRKNFPTCKSKFANGANFRGFPHIPGADHVALIGQRGAPGQDGGSLFSGR